MEKDRREIIASFGVHENVIDELLVYNTNCFDTIDLSRLPVLPLEDEPQMAVWNEYYAEAQEIGVYASLKKRLLQLNFPIREGISKSDFYISATLKGVPLKEIPEATGLELQSPKSLKFIMQKTQAGTIPIIIAGVRQDFISLVQALSAKNEPRIIPDSMGATMIAGLNNWDRIGRLKKEWEKDNPSDFLGLKWNAEFKRITADKQLYQDKFIILSSSPYSGVASSELGLSNDEWADLSLTLRREHECTHYFTKRVLCSMQNRLHDEIIADYIGIVAAIGYYRSDWFLRFMGLEAYPDYRKGGRLENYCLNAELSDEAFTMLQTIAVKASQNIEKIDKKSREILNTSFNRSIMVILLTQYSIEELACEDIIEIISDQFILFPK